MLHTCVLTAVAKPILLIGIPLRAMGMSLGLLVFVWCFGVSPIVGMILAGLLHAFFIHCTLKDPHFDKVWLAAYRHSSTMSLDTLTQGHRYAGW